MKPEKVMKTLKASGKINSIEIWLLTNILETCCVSTIKRVLMP
jgi:hypothetical protein